jgi:Domain of unknown function (DUF4394)/Bacterial TSP3 repeat/Thrombospondin type 3 repeat
VDFTPLVDRARYVNVGDENARLNPNNGALSGDDANLTPGATTDLIGLAYDRNVGVPVGSPPPPGSATTVWGINRNTNRLSIQGGVNASVSGGPNGGTVADAGSLGVVLDAGADGGFDISFTGSAFAALTVGGSTGLYALALPSPTATLVGPIGDGATQVYSLTINPDTDGDGLLYAADNCPAAANADQADLDGDAAGDACDADDDGDGLSDSLEAAIGSDPRSANSDGDGVGDGGDACPTVSGTTSNGCPDIALPETTITKAPKRKTTKRKATVEFTSNEPGSTFACSLDHKPFAPCASPHKYKRLKAGRHFVDVRAIDPANNLDPTPATAAWRVRPGK